MKTLEYRLGGEIYHLCLNGAALFDSYDKFGEEGSLIDHIQGRGKPAFDATCWLLAKLAEQGELVRRYQGHAKQPIPTQERFAALLRPRDVPAAKAAIIQAAALGFAREEDGGEDEVDLGLAELEKKTAPD